MILQEMSAVAVVFALGTAIYHYRSKLDLRERVKLSRELLEGLSVSRRIEENLTHVLQIAGRVVIAPYYAFYIWDKRGHRFALRAVSHPYDSFEGVGPAYSGLALPKREAYLPPSTLEEPDGTEPFTLKKDGDVPLAVVRVGRTCGLLRIGPVRSVTRQQQRRLTEFASLLERPLEDFLHVEDDRLKMELRALSDAAITRVASLAGNTYASVQVLLQAFTGIIGGKGVVFAEQSAADGSVRVHASDQSGWAEKLGAADIGRLKEMVADGSEKLVTRADGEFYDLPSAIISHDDVGAVALVLLKSRGILAALYPEQFERNAWQGEGRVSLRFLTDQLDRMLAQGVAQRRLSRTYTRLLCQIADVVDNLNPFTVGYSDMMTHYALAMGKEMGLSDGEMADLALAARLSNIGAIGMDMRLLVKEGRYNSFEYNLMKRHSEISASMIELVTGNARAARYVLQHHERVDGNGYPAGLKEDQILSGAKILHVTQVFLAKVNGRSWRSPLTFEQAMDELRNSVGTSLDGAAVSAFEAWWSRQAGRPERAGKTLGKCHEMCCVPRVICESCPAFESSGHCWDMKDNHCKSHGRECDSCFVKTEFLYRSKKASQ